MTLQKVRNLGIDGKLFEWIQSFLTNRNQCVTVEGTKSSMEPVLSGVPQGSVIGPLLYLIMINDIDTGVSTAQVSSFADDTRVLAGISSIGDSEALQQDLETIYGWSLANNSVFNSDKFECIRYGNNKEIINSTEYYSNNLSAIESKQSLRDLGVTISSDGSFSDHIFKMIKTANLKCAWILRSFKTREPKLLLTLWKSLVLPLLDYCSQLWSPATPGLIQAIEKVQQSYIDKITGMRGLNYWAQLQALKLYSLQRRRDRCICIYMWKVSEHLVPNFGTEVIQNNRTGRYFRIPHISTTAPGRIKTIRFNSMGINGPRIFNCLPLRLRNMTNCPVASFKGILDQYLETIPDEPRVPGLTRFCSKGSNSLIEY